MQPMSIVSLHQSQQQLLIWQKKSGTPRTDRLGACGQILLIIDSYHQQDSSIKHWIIWFVLYFPFSVSVYIIYITHVGDILSR